MTGEPSRVRRLAPYLVVGTLGVLFAVGAFLGADRDPGIWIIPPLILTALLLLAIRLVDARGEQRTLERAGADPGLRYAGQQTLPPVTPVLVGARPPRVTHLLRGDLDPGGPEVRLGRVAQRSGEDLLVCLTDAHDDAARLADPHRILALTDVQRDDEPLEPALLDWLAEHPARLALATGEGSLVLAAPVPRDGDPPYRVLLEATRQARARLAPRLW